MDALSSTSPRALQLTDRGFKERSLHYLHRLGTGLADDLIAPFRHALSELDELDETSTSPIFDAKASTSVANLVLSQVPKTDASLPSVLEPLRLWTSCGKICDAAALRILGESGPRLEKLVASERSGLPEIQGWLSDAYGQPYQVSTEEEIDVLVLFWERVFSLFPEPPKAVTAIRSPFYSPRETIRHQECSLLGAFRKLWPTAGSMRAGTHFEAWHEACPAPPDLDDSRDVRNWRMDDVGTFHGATKSSIKWDKATPENVVYEFGPSFRSEL